MALPADQLEMLQGLQEPFRSTIIRMIEDSGGRLWVKSGYRTPERQQQLWADALRRYGDPEIADNWVARPGTSNHEHGWAVDLGGDLEWAHQNAGAYGLMFPMSWEDWHIEWAGDRAGGQAGSTDRNGAYWQGGVMYNLDYGRGAAQNPQDVLAERLHSMMSILGLDAASGGPGVTTTPIADPSMDVLMQTPQVMAPGTDASGFPEMQPHQVQAPMQLGGMIEGGQGAGGNMGGSQAGFGGSVLGAAGVDDPNGYGAYAKSKFGQYGWNDQDYKALVWLWNKESGDPENKTTVLWNPLADNENSTAFGIAQFLDGTWGTVGGHRTEDPWRQMDYGMEYIAQRYGNPRNALAFHLQNNWY